MEKIYLFFLVAFLCGCNNNSETSNGGDNTGGNPASIALERKEVNPKPVAVYDHALPGDLNDWHFTVSLKETNRRFNYLLEMRYEEITGEDTIRFPNFGMEPQPQIIKGDNDKTCIIGFLDKNQQFREYIKVFIEDEQLRVKTLKQYAVYEK